MNYGRMYPRKWTTHTESRPLTPVYPEPGPAGRRALTPMPSPNSPVTRSNFQLLTSNLCNPFSFTLLSKNASASPLESHTFKTKDLKPFRFTHLQKSGRGRGCLGVSLSDFVLLISYLRFWLTPLDSALTSKRAPKSFTSNTYEKHTQGEGVGPSSPITSHERFMRAPTPVGTVRFTLSSFDCQLSTFLP